MTGSLTASMTLNFPSTFSLLFICLIQFLIIIQLFIYHHLRYDNLSPIKLEVPEKVAIPLALTDDLQVLKAVDVVHSNATTKTYQGVAVTMMLHSPTWYQRRYSLMIQNTVSTLPADWVVQIFYTAKGQSQAGLDINPGINRFIKSGEVILTLLPKHLEKIKKYQLMFEPWTWRNMLADKVLLFGGGSVICSNSLYTINDFIQYDYIGAPWRHYNGVGGDGQISLRNRLHMLAAIHYALEKVDIADHKTAWKSWGQEDHFYVTTLLEMATLKRIDSLIASKAATYQFAAIGSYVNDTVFAASGTIPEADYQSRDLFLSYCPEAKIHYPSMHDPNCFGASPHGEECAKTVCALRPKTMRKGGC